MHGRLASLLGVIGFVLVAGYWGLKALSGMMSGDGEAGLPDVSDVLVRALAAMVVCFIIGWLLGRHGVSLMAEVRDEAAASQVVMEAVRTPAAPVQESGAVSKTKT
jgi:hypothetical protein